MSGKPLLRQTALLKKGINAININGAKQFTGGMYLLMVSTSLQKQTLKIAKE